MSGELIGLVYERVLGKTDRAILIAMAENADRHGLCWPGAELIAWKTDYDESTVRRAWRRMRESGVLVIAKKSTQHFPTTYQITLDALPKKEPLRPGTDAASELAPVPPDLAEVPDRPGMAAASPSIRAARPGTSARSERPDLAPVPLRPGAAVPAEPSKEPSVEDVRSSSAYERHPDSTLRSAVAAACGLDGRLLDRTQTEAIDGLTRKLDRMGVPPEFVEAAGRSWPEKFPNKRPENVRPPTVDQLMGWIGQKIAERKPAEPPRDRRIWFKNDANRWQRRHPSLVLPAFGCDAYADPEGWPEELAEVYADQLARGKHGAKVAV